MLKTPVFIGIEHLVFEWLKTRRGQVVGSIGSCLLTTASAAVLVPLGVGNLSLYRTAVVIDATVVQTQIYYETDRRTPRVGAVRYAFDVAGRSYHFSGVSGNEWATVPLEEFDALSPRGPIRVAYAPEDPTNNTPAGRLRWLGAWGGGFVLVPIVLTVLAWRWVARVLRRQA